MKVILDLDRCDEACEGVLNEHVKNLKSELPAVSWDWKTVTIDQFLAYEEEHGITPFLTLFLHFYDMGGGHNISKELCVQFIPP